MRPSYVKHIGKILFSITFILQAIPYDIGSFFVWNFTNLLHNYEENFPSILKKKEWILTFQSHKTSRLTIAHQPIHVNFFFRLVHSHWIDRKKGKCVTVNQSKKWYIKLFHYSKNHQNCFNPHFSMVEEMGEIF